MNPCPWPASAELEDEQGGRMAVCASHAAHRSAAALRGGQRPFQPGDRVLWRGARVSEAVYAEVVREGRPNVRDVTPRYLIRHPDGEAWAWAHELERDPARVIA